MTQPRLSSSQGTKTLPRRSVRQNRQRVMISLTFAAVILAWLVGFYTSGTDILPLVPEVLPAAETIESRGDLFIGYSPDNSTIVGYAATGEAPGHGGPILVLVGVNPAGEITGVKIVKQNETPGFFRLVIDQGLIGQFIHRKVVDRLQLGNGIDAVSGATLSAEGIAASIHQAARTIADEGLHKPLAAESRPVEFGIPEIVLLLLFTVGYFGHKIRHPGWKSRLRWVSLLSGMLVLGFLYTIPLTISMIISLISGFWPDWHSNLYWYLLMGGIIFVTTVDAKNPYCSWFCPFGAFQECLGALTGAKTYRPRNINRVLEWVQRGLALVAIILGLLFRQPGFAEYEPFATLFNIQGSGLEWAFLVLIILASLFIFRPFCNYLCPVSPVIDLIAATRRLIRKAWVTWKKNSATD